MAFSNETRSQASSRSKIGTAASKQKRNLRYQLTKVETASPAQLVLMLYDGAIRFCTIALDSMSIGNLSEQNEYLIKAQRILGELISSINRDAGGQIAENLTCIYAFILEQLVTANLYDRADLVNECISLLESLRDGWSEAELILRSSSPQQLEAPAHSSRLGDFDA